MTQKNSKCPKVYLNGYWQEWLRNFVITNVVIKNKENKEINK